MKRVSMALLMLGASASALATGRLADVSVVDRDSGATLATHQYRGEYWVAGRPGARYAVRIASRSGERLLAVTAVDGVNAITGDTAAFGQTGYVFAPWQAYDVAGWRKSDSEVAAFVFTATPASYAARTGRPFSVGVIGVALFRERAAAPPPAPQAAARGESAMDAVSEQRPAAKLGTGHGDREYSWVQRTDFERRSTQPDEIIRIRYDSRDNLVAMGVIPRGEPRAPVPEPFPASPLVRYVPDPPRQ